MSDSTNSLPCPKLYRGGWILSGLVIAFLVMDAGMKLAGAEVSVVATTSLGYSASHVARIGFVLLVVTALYAVPNTAVLGAVLATGYLGGAVASQLRVDAPLFSHVLFGVYLGLALWGGLYLREPRLRALFRLRR